MTYSDLWCFYVKFRPCLACGSSNQASHRTCRTCFTMLSKKKKKDVDATITDEWGENVRRNRNSGRILDSARVVVRKLKVLGYKPILFLAKKKNNKLTADVLTHLSPNERNQSFLNTMRRAYEFLVVEDERTSQKTRPVVQAHAEQEAASEADSVTVTNSKPETGEEDGSSESELSEPRLNTNGTDPLQESVHIQEMAGVAPFGETDVVEEVIESQEPHSKKKTKKKTKDCRKCSKQKVFKYEKFTARRTKKGKAEVKVRWLPCSSCGRIWEDTWEPASLFPF